MTDDRLVHDLTHLVDPAENELDALRARLVATAEKEGVLDVAYRVVDSPVGSLLLAATDVGLVRVAYAVEGHDAVLQQLADMSEVGHQPLAAPLGEHPPTHPGHIGGFEDSGDTALAGVSCPLPQRIGDGVGQ